MQGQGFGQLLRWDEGCKRGNRRTLPAGFGSLTNHSFRVATVYLDVSMPWHSSNSSLFTEATAKAAKRTARITILKAKPKHARNEARTGLATLNPPKPETRDPKP